MSKVGYFFLIETALIIVIAFIRFKNLKDFFNTLYSFLFGTYYIFFKKLWDQHFDKSFRFTIFLLISAFFTGINILVFKYIVK